MHVLIRRYAGAADQAEEANRRTQVGLVGALRQMNGFLSYATFASEQGDAVSISVFGSRWMGWRANDTCRDWVNNNLRDILPMPPDILSGVCDLHVTSPQPTAGQERAAEPDHPFVVVRRYTEVHPDLATEMMRQHIVPIIKGAAGFHEHFTFFDEQRTSYGVGMTLFHSRDHAMAANDQIVAAIRGYEVAPNPPQVITGRVDLMAA